MEKIKKAIEAFTTAGDNNDANLLNTILHPKFQNIQDKFFNKEGIYIFSKSEYIELVSNKTFGGNPRTIHYKSIEKAGNCAIAKVELNSLKLKFSSTIICVCIDDNWQVINNTPKIIIKNLNEQ